MGTKTFSVVVTVSCLCGGRLPILPNILTFHHQVATKKYIRSWSIVALNATNCYKFNTHIFSVDEQP